MVKGTNMLYKIDISSQSLERIIHEAIEEFICKDRVLLQRELSERALCGALMKRIYDVLASKGFEDFKDYFVDVEFNRRYSNQKNTVKTTLGPSDTKKLNDVKKIAPITQGDEKEVKKKLARIFTDIIVHGRGVLKSELPDNLIAIEMKKKLRDTKCYNREYVTLKNEDENRLKKFTCNEEELVKYFGYPKDDKSMVVYGYLLGVFIEIDYTNKNKNKCVKYSFYRHGKKYGEEKSIPF